MLGPTIIFDKSTLQSLTIDESCWLDNFFVSNITPLLYVETLADLEKEVKGRRTPQTPQQVVGELAVKTPSAPCFPNLHHHTLFVNNLLGYPVTLANVPAIGTGQPMRSGFGVGVHYRPFPEVEALQRWQHGEFLAVERDFAREWRRSLSSVSFEPGLALVKGIAPRRFKTLAEVKTFVDQLMDQMDEKILHAALYLQEVPAGLADKIVVRWVESNRPPFGEFAPYAAHVLKVDLFFFLSLASDLISRDRPSNRIDVAYLYYLPFTMIFASDDKLHKKTAPLFMETGQVFVLGRELKSALGQLDTYYWGLPSEVKEQGIITMAPYPPEQCETLVTKLWDRFSPSWRQSAIEARSPQRGDEVTVESLERTLGQAMPIGSVGEAAAEPDYYHFQSLVERTKGKWNILPPDVG